MKIIPIDCNYVESEFATSYLLIHEHEGKSRGLFVECNTNYAIPYLIQAAERNGLARDQIDGLIITHVHLDHAGGAGLFMQTFVNARLFAHPRAARHAIDPSKLIASATAVYGEEFMQKVYGAILPCPADRVVVVENGESISWAGVRLETKHTRGHANHHLCVIEPITRTLFSGDAFGVSYPKVNEGHGLVVIASTSPTDFDGDAAIETVEWIRTRNIDRVALTHYGFLELENVDSAARQLTDQLSFAISLVARIRVESLSVDAVVVAIEDWMIRYYALKGSPLDAEDLQRLSIDFKVNAQGLHFAAMKEQKN
jgi:glyoxylase-like metal-dependent hydrolase (beta-lactamase superfamily II)